MSNQNLLSEIINQLDYILTKLNLALDLINRSIGTSKWASVLSLIIPPAVFMRQDKYFNDIMKIITEVKEIVSGIRTKVITENGDYLIPKSVYLEDFLTTNFDMILDSLYFKNPPQKVGSMIIDKIELVKNLLNSLKP